MRTFRVGLKAFDPLRGCRPAGRRRSASTRHHGLACAPWSRSHPEAPAGACVLTDPLVIVVRLAGGFYFLTAFLVVRAVAQTALLDAMLGALSATAPREAAATRIRRLWLTGGAVVTGLGGLAAAAAWSAAAHLFVLACLGQWTWLLVVAPLWVDPFDPPEAPGRRATRNAALGHTALTIAVLGAEAKLATWPELSWPIQTATAAAGAALVAFALYMLRQGVLAAPSKAGTQGNLADAADDAHDSPSPPDEE